MAKKYFVSFVDTASDADIAAKHIEQDQGGEIVDEIKLTRTLIVEFPDDGKVHAAGDVQACLKEGNKHIDKVEPDTEVSINK